MPQFQNPYGIFTAIVTPFGAHGEIDLKAYDRLLEFQIENKVQGIVVCGTTGESPTLTKEEKKSLISHTVKKLKNTGVLTYANGSHNIADSGVSVPVLHDRQNIVIGLIK